MKHNHEFRDPIHTFISLRTDERRVVDSRPFQRLRHIHQLALTYLVYPGATHKRFEHSLGVMHLASRIFDVVTATENIFDESVRKIIPDEDAKRYWKSVLRTAALCHDLGHLPFSHAAEDQLLPEGYDHEKLTRDIISSPEMLEIWETMTPRLRSDDIIKLAIGPKKADPLELNTWESILAEIIIGDAFGADRMDYLLRDSLHAGVEYGKFDHNRLINTLRILPQSYADTDEPALGLESGGLESSEGLMVARYFMYKQVYLHPIRRVYDVHLIDFLKSWLPSGKFSTKLEKHLRITDAEVLTAILQAYAAPNSSNHILAKRIQCRDHFRYFYLALPSDKLGGKLIPGKTIAAAAAERFGKAAIRYDHMPPKVSAPNFPVRLYDGAIDSSLKSSPLLERLPPIGVDTVYCDKSILADAVRWKQANVENILELK
jgi:HD superfamily phosphohydrolase